MNAALNKDTYYFLEIELDSLAVVRVGSNHKANLDRGRQTRDGIHRVFISKGQYNRFVKRCESDLQHVLDS